MRRNLSFLIVSAITTLISFSSCSNETVDDFGTTSSPSYIEAYGLKRPVVSAVAWKSTPYQVTSREEYIFTDEYQNSEGVLQKDMVVGYVTGTDSYDAGNFQLSVYGEGLFFNENLKEIYGKGPAISFHIVSPNTEKIEAGVYKYQKSPKEKFTFTAYYSTEYTLNIFNNYIMEITEGEINVAVSGDEYTLSFDCKSASGSKVSGVYKGAIHVEDLGKIPFASHTDIQLGGLMIGNTHRSLRSLSRPANWATATLTLAYDVSQNMGVLSSTSGISMTPTQSARSSETDIALIYNRDNPNQEYVYFESPIKIRSYLGHNSTYNHPCHTTYMRAPSSFSHADFENFQLSDFPERIEPEDIRFYISDFKPAYVFFHTGNNVKGILHVKSYTEFTYVYETPSPLGNPPHYQNERSPSLFMDIKCPASYNNSKIR